jgi:glycosyltransferase involved in cell wall biosynthesis
MHVAISTSVIQRGRSGVATYVFGLLDGLRAACPEVEVTILGLDGDRDLFARWLDCFNWVPVGEGWRPAVRNVVWHQAGLSAALRRCRADLVHIPSYRRIAWRTPCPQVATIHDCAAFELRGKYDALRVGYTHHVVTHLARRVQRVIAVSRHAATGIAAHFGLPAEALTVIPNGINHERFRARPQPEARELLARAAAQHEPYFLSVARLEHPGKNHVGLIDAFERFTARQPARREQLVLAGADWHGADVIRARAAASPVRDRIRFAGFVTDDLLPVWYAGASALVFPSLFEGFGLPAIEAMACGCPVIASNRGSLPEVVGDAATIIDPSDPAAIASAMESVLAPSCAADLRERGQRRAAGFSWTAAASATAEVYRNALAGPHRA